jgi:hypothetical protein
MVQGVRYRVEGEFVVLQVLEQEAAWEYQHRVPSKWRDAKVTDLLNVAEFGREPIIGLDRRLSRLEGLTSKHDLQQNPQLWGQVSPQES